MLITHFKPVIFGRVMGGGDINSTNCLLSNNRIRDHWCRGGFFGEEDRKTVPGQHLGHRSGKILGMETSIIPHNYGFLSMPFSQQECRKALSTTAEVIECVILSDPSAPTIGTKLDF